MKKTKKKSNKEYRIGELFAGAGGMALGATRAEYKGHKFVHVWANDNDQNACNTFRNNLQIEPENVLCCDIQDLKVSELAPIDGLVFGFPCNDFSVVGEKKGIHGKFGGTIPKLC